MALKQRASSLPQLEHQEASDNRSETSQGWSGSQRDSRTPDGDLKEEEEEKENGEMSTPERQVVFDDIDNDIFFKPRLGEREDVMSNGDGTCNNNSKKGKGRSATLQVNFDDRQSNSRSKGGTLGTKLTRLKDTIVSSTRSRVETKESVGHEHPDMVEQSRWSCSIL